MSHHNVIAKIKSGEKANALLQADIHDLIVKLQEEANKEADEHAFCTMAVTSEAAAQSCHCLEFDSWWNEGNKRRFVYIRYNISEGAFQIAIDEDSNLYHVPVVYGARTGEAVTVWDLHVGAEVDVLGRITTLQHCQQMTAQWNKYWAERLIGVREKLVEELRKYEVRKNEPWITWQKTAREAGAQDLRLLMSQVNELNMALAEYRPRLAERYCVPKEMYEIEEMHRTHASIVP